MIENQFSLIISLITFPCNFLRFPLASGSRLCHAGVK